MKFNVWPQLSIFALAIFGSFTLKTSTAIAAETIILKYGIVKLPVSFTELETFAETGEMSPMLTLLFKNSPATASKAQRTLTKSIPMNSQMLSQALDHRIGAKVLVQVGEVIYTENAQTDRSALKSALLLSAEDDNKITLLETIKNYPEQEVMVDGDRLSEIYTKIANLGGNITQVRETLKTILDKINIPF